MAQKQKTAHLTPPRTKDFSPGQALEYEIERRLFNALDIEQKGFLLKERIINELKNAGIDKHHDAFAPSFEILNNLTDGAEIDFEKFVTITKDRIALFEKAFTGGLVIPDFVRFTETIREIYEDLLKNKEGKVADYIPQLARVDDNLFGISICTVDGQMFSIGDSDCGFSVQSICKPVNYCLAQKELGEEFVHRYIGKEPSGHGFNVLRLNKNNQPHNPFLNAGGIMACSLICRQLDRADKFDYIMQAWTDLSGGIRPNFNNAIYLSERHTADRNFALAYFMHEKKAFMENTDIIEVLEFYFQCCSIELTTKSMSVVAATLASSGVCPITQKEIFDPKTVKNCLSLMNSCGLYDFSGEFAFHVGLPAKSGVSGIVMIVIPNVLGICVYSPKLDEFMNSVRGIAFANALVKKYNFHNYDSLIRTTDKEDPRRRAREVTISPVISLIWAASQGDLVEINRLMALGVDINKTDYDGRTALHLAASEGQFAVVNYLLQRQAALNPIDRWGGTPLSDARNGNHQEVVKLLMEHGCK